MFLNLQIYEYVHIKLVFTVNNFFLILHRNVGIIKDADVFKFIINNK